MRLRSVLILTAVACASAGAAPMVEAAPAGTSISAEVAAPQVGAVG